MNGEAWLNTASSTATWQHTGFADSETKPSPDAFIALKEFEKHMRWKGVWRQHVSWSLAHCTPKYVGHQPSSLDLLYTQVSLLEPEVQPQVKGLQIIQALKDCVSFTTLVSITNPSLNGVQSLKVSSFHLPSWHNSFIEDTMLVPLPLAMPSFPPPAWTAAQAFSAAAPFFPGIRATNLHEFPLLSTIHGSPRRGVISDTRNQAIRRRTGT